jgi:hypothetical protein
MFENVGGGDAPAEPVPEPEPEPEPAAPVTAAMLRSWIAGLTGLDRSVGDAERVTQLELLERLKSAAAAAQAVVTVDFAASQRAGQIAAGVPAGTAGAGVGAQVGLARRDSPFRGGRYLGLAQALTRELPETMAALRAGDVSEWRATLVARETACLDPADRRAADAELGPVLAGLGDREIEAAARAVAYRLDPRAFVDRTRGASKDRTVTLRPAPDTMSRLSGFLPVAQGVAAHTALSREADRLRAAGDARTRGQIMADTLVQRVTGQETAGAVPVEVVLVVSDQTLLAGGDEPGVLAGAGPVPATVARNLVTDPDTTLWLRRVYARPDDGSLVAMDSQRRRFPKGLRQLLAIRDQTCRTPWCGAPIRHTDHVIPQSEGGTTSAANGQGLCEACNYTKQAHGRTATPGPGPAGAGDRVEITTPTGHTYPSHPPPLPHARPPSDGRSLIEKHFRRLIHAA